MLVLLVAKKNYCLDIWHR